MGNPQLEKGNKLETAVELIEKAILNSDPSLRASNLIIQPKKIMIIDEVKYEIDLYVEIDHSFGYKSIYIFECKNWEDNVPPEQIVKFADKINVTNAQKGFFVAKGYTSYAEAKAKQDKRIALLYVDDSPIDLTPFFDFQFINKINKIIAMEVFGFGVVDKEKSKKTQIDFESCMVTYKGREGKFKDFAALLLEEMAGERMKDEKLNTLPEGKYSLEAEKEFIFQKDELIVKESSFDNNVEKVRIKAVFEIELNRPKIISKIDVLTRGRFIEYEAVKTSTGGEVKFAFVAINAPVTS